MERAKIGEEPLIDFKFFVLSPIVFKFNKTAALQGNKRKMPDICGDAVGITPRGFPCFPLAGDLEGNAPTGSTFLFGQFSKCFCYSIRIAEKVSNPLWSFPKESLIPYSSAQIVSKSF
jgi:hypothetical protein